MEWNLIDVTWAILKFENHFFTMKNEWSKFGTLDHT